MAFRAPSQVGKNAIHLYWVSDWIYMGFVWMIFFFFLMDLYGFIRMNWDSDWDSVGIHVDEAKVWMTEVQTHPNVFR